MHQAVFDGLPYLIAVLNPRGEIVSVNRAWQEATAEQGTPLPHLCTDWVGCNYAEILEASVWQGLAGASEALQSLQLVLNGERDHDLLEYGAPWSSQDRRYLLSIKRIQTDELAGVIISYSDVTESMTHQEVQIKTQTEFAAGQQREQELRSLEQLSRPLPAAITSQTFGLYPLSQSYPELYGSLVQTYRSVLEEALDRKIHPVEHHISDQLRTMAEEMGQCRAGPRDVIAIHTAVLRQTQPSITTHKKQVYMEESRLLVLELMGYLAAYYRNFALIGLNGRVVKEQPRSSG